MNKDRSALLKKVSKTLALGVPVVALSGFLPSANFAVSNAVAEGDSDTYASEAKSEAKSKAKYKYSSKAKSEAKYKAKSEAKAEAEAEGKNY
jgi:hypothetical protein